MRSGATLGGADHGGRCASGLALHDEEPVDQGSAASAPRARAARLADFLTGASARTGDRADRSVAYAMAVTHQHDAEISKGTLLKVNLILRVGTPGPGRDVTRAAPRPWAGGPAKAARHARCTDAARVRRRPRGGRDGGRARARGALGAASGRAGWATPAHRLAGAPRG